MCGELERGGEKSVSSSNVLVLMGSAAREGTGWHRGKGTIVWGKGTGEGPWGRWLWGNQAKRGRSVTPSKDDARPVPKLDILVLGVRHPC